MRIAIDAREMTGRPTGVGRYLSEILCAWSQLPDAGAHEFILCAPDPLECSLTGLSITCVIEPGHGTIWEQWTLPRLVARGGADVLFAPAYTAPLRCQVPVVLTIHDVSFAAHPEWFPWREGLRRRTVARMSARRAARVITDSEFSKREIASRLGVDGSRIDVIYLGSSSPPPPAPREPLVLYAGSIFNRRHLPALIEGFALIAAHHLEVRLEIVGDNRTFPPVDLDRTIAESGASDRIRMRRYLPDAELSSLHARAAVFVFLSEYEGFGLTPLEAMAAGVPVVVLDTEVAREIYGAAAEYVEGPDPALVASALERVLVDHAVRTRLVDAAAKQIQRYSWRACARRTLEVLLASGGRESLRNR